MSVSLKQQAWLGLLCPYPFVPRLCATQSPPLLTRRQLATLDLLKGTVPGFRVMRRLALRFRALFRGRKPEKLDGWIVDAAPLRHLCAAALRHDAPAGRRRGEGTDLLRVRMLPLSNNLMHKL
jgi:hypothetical protein